MKLVLLALILLFLMIVSKEEKMDCTYRMDLESVSPSDCWGAGKSEPLLNITTFTVKFYDKRTRIIFHYGFFKFNGSRREGYVDGEVNFDPETDAIGLHFYAAHNDDHSVDDNPVKSGFLFREYEGWHPNVEKTYGKGTDLSEMYYRRPVVLLPQAQVECKGTKYPLWQFGNEKCNSRLVVANHGTYEFVENPLSVVPVYYVNSRTDNIYYF